MGSSKLQKMSGILGHDDEKNLSRMTVSKDKYIGIAMGPSGYVAVLSQNQKKLLFDLKMSGSAQTVCFSPCEKYMFSVGD